MVLRLKNPSNFYETARRRG